MGARRLYALAGSLGDDWRGDTAALYVLARVAGGWWRRGPEEVKAAVGNVCWAHALILARYPLVALKAELALSDLRQAADRLAVLVSHDTPQIIAAGLVFVA